MSGFSKIEWTDRVWNPVTGCTKISPGCTNCYAERMAKRLAGRCGYPKENPFQVTLHPERLDESLRWTKPWRVFVCSMGDLFHTDVPFEFVRAVWSRMATARQHNFQVLTKRPKRMKEFFGWMEMQEFKVESYLPHIWLGVTAEDQARADERIPILLQVPAVVRFVSVEPMLGPVDLTPWFPWDKHRKGLSGWAPNPNYEQGLHWVICGGESGPGARPCHPDWVQSIRDQCQQAEIPFFFKQWGEWMHTSIEESGPFIDTDQEVDDSDYFIRVGKKKAGCILDGRKWNEFPS